jgi:hypothetical protein
MISNLKDTKRMRYHLVSKDGLRIRYGNNILSYLFKSKTILTLLFLSEHLDIMIDARQVEDLNELVRSLYPIYNLRKHKPSIDDLPKESFIRVFRRKGIKEDVILANFSNHLFKYLERRETLLSKLMELFTLEKKYTLFPKITEGRVIALIVDGKSLLRAPPKTRIFQGLLNAA